EERPGLCGGCGWTPPSVEGAAPERMPEEMAAVLEDCVLEIRRIQRDARACGTATRAHWPMIVLRSPKGWTGPREVDGHKVEGFWRAHQVPLAGLHENPPHLNQLEQWVPTHPPREPF